MKAVKKAVCFILTLIILITLASTVLCLFQSGSVYATAASSKYARADARDIYFCERKDLNSALFTIPYTYCVEILSSDGEWLYVKYAEDNSIYRALYGYCLTQNLTPVDEPPANTYLNMPVTVTFKADAPSGSLPVLNELNVTAAFYGAYYSGASAYSYVLYDGKFGYIYGANEDYPLNEISVPSEPIEPENPETGSANTTLIIALVLVGVAAVALLLLYFTGKRKYYRPDK